MWGHGVRGSKALARSSGRVGGRRGGRRRTAEVLVGVTALTVALVALGGALLQAKPQTQREAVRAAGIERGEAAADGVAPALTPAGGDEEGGAGAAKPSKHTDRRALAYFVGRKQTKRLKDIRVVGGYLRIYTDLPESADNSKRALKLCETGRDYLVGELGETDPVVFVQARFGENGNPVLANILGHGDSDCRVTHPKPRR
ncbi:hypothetical protein GCM10017673_07540 [Streptosporangium violaceochromogenes]|nr:hypothetical protein GCM10017673_07540 [Streptosporangium violaceochromogenes]